MAELYNKETEAWREGGNNNNDDEERRSRQTDRRRRRRRFKVDSASTESCFVF